MRENFFSWNYFKYTIDELIETFNSNSKPQAVHFIASHALAEAYKDSQLYDIFEKDLIVCDGKPLSIYFKLCNKKIKQIRGTDFMRNFLIVSKPGSVHYFLGSTEESHRGIQNFINSNSKHQFICHFYSPKFGLDWKQEIDRWIGMIVSEKADYVWVGMGAPKQFKIANEITSRSGKTTFSVGAAFDFIAETKKESPKWLNELGLEWAYRLFSEPKRLLHRYTIGNFEFLSILLFTFLRLTFQKILMLSSKFLNS